MTREIHSVRATRRESRPDSKASIKLRDPRDDIATCQGDDYLYDLVQPSWTDLAGLEIAVLLPCRNEEATIAKVVRDFRSSLPMADIYVYDNGSTDRTRRESLGAGAVWRSAPQRGKGNVVRRMFAEVDADVYVLADGDDTYDASAAPGLIRWLREHRVDMVVGLRVDAETPPVARRPSHRLGNRLLTRSIHWLFGDGSQDMLSGYRIVTKRFAKSFPAHSRGFEVETEMTVHALDLQIPVDEVPTLYRERPPGSLSKLRTVPDGIKIVKFILSLWKDYRPLRFFGALALMFAALFATTFVARGGHPHGSALFLRLGLAEAAVLMLFAGVVLDSLGKGRRELKRMLYLALPAMEYEQICSSDAREWSSSSVARS